jgi:hypothetical protein
MTVRCWPPTATVAGLADGTRLFAVMTQSAETSAPEQARTSPTRTLAVKA